MRGVGPAGRLLGGRRLLSHRVEPTGVGHALGRGQVVRGTTEALGVWLRGRRSVEGEAERLTEDRVEEID